jgi:hypothetical protein
MLPAPTMVAMRVGGILRFEELTRCVPDVQDALVSVLSDKAIAVPELPDANMVWARPGFNIIATANTRDQGVNELSAALKRRFNYVYIPIVADQKTEIEIVRQRSAELFSRYQLPTRIAPPMIELLATVFRELRAGKTGDGVSLKKPSTAVSTAEAIGVALDAALHARFFGAGDVRAADLARNLLGSIVKEDQADRDALKEYAVLVAKKRGGKDRAWQEFHDACWNRCNDGGLTRRRCRPRPDRRGAGRSIVLVPGAAPFAGRGAACRGGHPPAAAEGDLPGSAGRSWSPRAARDRPGDAAPGGHLFVVPR